MASLSSSQIRAIILYNYQRDLSRQRCFEEMFRVLLDLAPSLNCIERWYKQFEKGNYNLESEPRCPSEYYVMTPETVAAVQKLIKEDRRISCKQIQETLKISSWVLNNILHQHLNVRKISSVFVPSRLNNEQRSFRIEWCKTMLSIFKGRSNAELWNIVTGDETCLYYYDLPTKSRSTIWMLEDDDVPNSSYKYSRTIKKRMISVFFAREGLIKIVIMDNQRNAANTPNRYIESCLIPLFQTLKELRPKNRLNDWYLHNANKATSNFIDSSGIRAIDHPPNSPDLAPTDFGLFPYVNHQLKGRKFPSDVALLAAWEDVCSSIPDNKWKEWFDDWFERMDKCVESNGNYFDKQ